MSKENLNRASDCFGGCSSSACFVQGLMEPYPSISLKSSIRTFPKHPQNQIISLEMVTESKDIQHGDPCHDISLRPFEVPSGEPDFCMLHEGRIEEAIREFHSVCNRVPRTNYYQLMKFEKLKGHFTLETTWKNYGSNMLPLSIVTAFPSSNGYVRRGWTCMTLGCILRHFVRDWQKQFRTFPS